MQVELIPEEEYYDDYVDNVSMWVKDKDYFIPSTDIKVLKTLPAGMYKVDNTKDRGLHCKSISFKSDSLYTFSDSKTELVLNEIRSFWDKEKLYADNKLIHKRGILFYGYPGTGKSSVLNIICSELIEKGGVVFKISSPRNLVDYIDFLRFGFNKIESGSRIITIIEDIDDYSEMETELLEFLDGQFNINHHLLLATSNDTTNIPDTVLRPSRIDLKVEIPYPSEKTREEFFRFKSVPEEDLEELVTETEDLSLADLKEIYICRYILDYTLEQAIDKVTEDLDKKDYTSVRNKNYKLGL